MMDAVTRESIRAFVLAGREDLAPATEPVLSAAVAETALTAEPVSELELNQAAGKETRLQSLRTPR